MRATIPLLALVLSACTGDDAGFGDGGSGTDAPDCTPSCDVPDTGDTGSYNGGTDSGDTGSGADTGDTPDTADTAAPLEPTGYDEGDVIYDLTGTTQAGAAWNLWGGRGSTQVLVIGHAWDDNLDYIAGYLPELDVKLPDLEVTLVLEQAMDTTEADQDDASDYASLYGLSRVVWGADTSSFASTTPKTFVIDRNLTVRMTAVGIVYRSEVASAIEKAP